MAQELKGLKVAILATDGFEQSELAEPKKALEKAGADVDIVSLKKGKIKGWKHTQWGDEFEVNADLQNANPQNYQALVLPGGVMNPDRLRLSEDAIHFIQDFVKNDKPIAAICHGPWTLINAGGVKGKTMTSWPSIKMDLTNAGADWKDKEVIRDGNLITSRKPDDLPAFNEEMIKVFAKAKK
jgi:protease I